MKTEDNYEDTAKGYEIIFDTLKVEVYKPLAL